MRTFGNVQGSDTALIYAGLGQISGKGRETLKQLAQSLVWAQNNPGYPVPEGIGRQIRRGLGVRGGAGKTGGGL